MSTFSTTVTKAQRKAAGIDARGFAVSPDSRHNINCPGYNRSPFEPKASTVKLSEAVTIMNLAKTIIKEREKKTRLQVRPKTKRGDQKQPTHKQLDRLTLNQFYDAECQFLHAGKKGEGAIIFAGIRLRSGDVCTSGCGWFNNGKCSTYQTLLKQEKSQ